MAGERKLTQRQSGNVHKAASKWACSIRTIYRALERTSYEELMAAMPEEELLKPSEAARLLRCSKSTIYRYLTEGKLTEVRLFGTLVRVKKSELIGMIETAMAGGMEGAP